MKINKNLAAVALCVGLFGNLNAVKIDPAVFQAVASDSEEVDFLLKNDLGVLREQAINAQTSQAIEAVRTQMLKSVEIRLGELERFGQRAYEGGTEGASSMAERIDSQANEFEHNLDLKIRELEGDETDEKN